MRIKPLDTREELHGAMRIHNQAWRVAYRDLLPEAVIDDIPTDPPTDFVEERFADLGAEDEVFLVAVNEDDRAIGYIYVLWGEETKEFVGEKEAGLKEIYVHPDRWGDGIGTALLNEALEVVPPTIEAIRLEMLAGNKRAREFYTARGFEVVDESEFEIAGELYPTDVYVRPL